MEYITNELKRNGVNIDKEVFKEQMNMFKKEYGPRYEEIMKRVKPEDLTGIFHTMNMNNYGRVLSYLLLLYYERKRGVDITEPLRLVAIAMKVISKKSRKTICQRLNSIAYIYMVIFVKFLILYYSISLHSFL